MSFKGALTAASLLLAAGLPAAGSGPLRARRVDARRSSCALAAEPVPSYRTVLPKVVEEAWPVVRDVVIDVVRIGRVARLRHGLPQVAGADGGVAAIAVKDGNGAAGVGHMLSRVACRGVQRAGVAFADEHGVARA